MKKILINALHQEEKRVAIVDGDRLVDFYLEVASREQLKGNIYKGVVVRLEPGIQAAFVDFGSRKHGFLQIRELMPEFFKNVEKGKRARIQEVLTKGQELVIQVEKDERDTKGASLTTYLSLPGRYIVMMPGQDRVGVSRKIEEREDRQRLKETFNALKLPKDMGFILRTACSDRTGEELAADLKYLTRLWTKIQGEVKKAKAPALIYKEQDIAVRTVRDYLTSDVGEVLIDDEDAFRKTKDFLRRTLPWRKINVRLFREKRPIFSMHNLEAQINKINDRYVHLESKGYLVFDKTEALTAIDVNSGRSRKEENVESTALRTNLEAAEEIPRQLRMRDIGGLIAVDFIDMSSPKHCREVENKLKEDLSADKAHTETTALSKFGIIEITRERLRPAYLEAIHDKCPACGGTGMVKSDEAVALAAFREIHARSVRREVRALTCRLPVESANYLINAKRKDIVALEKDFDLVISVIADLSVAPGQFQIDVIVVEATEESRAKDETKAKEVPRSNQEATAVEKTKTAAELGASEEPKSGEEAMTKEKVKAKGRGRSRSRGRGKGRGKGKEQEQTDVLEHAQSQLPVTEQAQPAEQAWSEPKDQSGAQAPAADEVQHADYGQEWM